MTFARREIASEPPWSTPFPARFWHASSIGDWVAGTAAAAHTGGRGCWEVMACVTGPNTGRAGNVPPESHGRSTVGGVCNAD